MIAAVSSETTAALLGALVGAGIAVIGQAVLGVFGTFRARRIAAQIIYAELIGNIANAIPAINGYGWSATKPEALRAAWDAYGARLLLPWHRAHDVGAIASLRTTGSTTSRGWRPRTQSCPTRTTPSICSTCTWAST
jgi:hypothetical protein